MQLASITKKFKMKQTTITFETDSVEYGLKTTLTILPKGSGHGEDYRHFDSYFRVMVETESFQNEFVSFTDNAVAFTKSMRLKKVIKNEIARLISDEQITKSVIALIEANV